MIAASVVWGLRGSEYLAPTALNLSVWLFHGAQDRVVAVGLSRQWYQRLAHVGTPIDDSAYPDVHHRAWEPAYAGGAISAWFERFRCVPFPARVRRNWHVPTAEAAKMAATRAAMLYQG